MTNRPAPGDPSSPYEPQGGVPVWPGSSVNGMDQYGRPLPAFPPAPLPHQGYGSGYGYGQPPAISSGLYTAAAVINWVVLGLLVVGTCGLGIVAAAWFIPMTIQIHKGAKDKQKHTALAVCTLLFCNLISGILMLCEEGARYQPRA